MAGFGDPGLLTPPREEEEIFPYRPVWRSVAIVSGLLLVMTVSIYVLVNVIGLSAPDSLRLYLGIPVALAPAGLYLVFSWFREQLVPAPRQRLIAVLVISGLVASAIGIPLINDFFQVSRWLPLSSAINRIVGYTFIVGIVQETLKYGVVRFTVWPQQYRIRLDAMAYGVAAAIGYATAVNIHFVGTYHASLDVVALRVFTTFAVHLSATACVSYGLAEVRFSDPLPFFLPMSLFVAALVTGVAIPIRAGLVNAAFALGVSATRPLFGLGFSVALLLGSLLVIAFLFNTAEQFDQGFQ